MSLYQCEKCGCIENTAVGWYHCRNMKNMVLPEFEGKALCSACGPAWFLDGSPTGLGKWHNRFKQEFHPLGTMETDAQGNIRPKAPGPTKEENG